MAPKLSTIGDQGEVRFVTNTPPTHYAVRLERFSLLAEQNVDRYDTEEFEVGKYKWKLIIYPNGNKSTNGDGYISVYIAMAEDSFTNQFKGIDVVFKVSILDQKYDNYYTVQVENGRNFNKMKLEWGFDRLMSLNELNDPSNGYLVGDVCVLGAGVYIIEHDICKAERLRMDKFSTNATKSWKIDDFSKPVLESTSFPSGDYEWILRLRTNGIGTGKGTHISIYLVLAGPAILPVATKIYGEFTLRVIDRLNAKHYIKKGNYWFSTSTRTSGWARFLSLTDFTDPSKGFLLNDKCLIEADVTVLGITTPL